MKISLVTFYLSRTTLEVPNLESTHIVYINKRERRPLKKKDREEKADGRRKPRYTGPHCGEYSTKSGAGGGDSARKMRASASFPWPSRPGGVASHLRPAHPSQFIFLSRGSSPRDIVLISPALARTEKGGESVPLVFPYSPRAA